MIILEFSNANMEVECPHCRKRVPDAGNPFRPFCSERCRLIDLGAWIKEQYVIPGEAPASPEKDADSGEGPSSPS
ncbi:MAG: hypothetical protein A2V67_11375 [Deltaproteobacteria bacterium RBG_13_61_14]|nr:MAG: hypothetical protein A2V67_11375 [Deltaproteobacteria bacterium RBG_13_61_14]